MVAAKQFASGKCTTPDCEGTEKVFLRAPPRSASQRYLFVWRLFRCLFVEEILSTQLLERTKAGVPALHNLFRRHILLQFPNGLVVAHEKHQLFRIELLRI